MEKPNESVIDGWITNRTRLRFETRKGEIKYGFLNACYGFGLHIRIDDPLISMWKTKKVYTFNQLTAINSLEPELSTTHNS